jgi:hypothetical protein
MATSTINLPISAAILPDGSASNAAPSITRRQGTNANPKRHYLTADYDASTDEHLWFSFRMPANYVSGGVVKILWTANATTGTARWGISLGAVTPSDVDTPLEHAQAAASTAGTATNVTEARRLNETSITIANLDSAATGDLLTLVVYRDADGTSGTDDLSVDAEVISIAVEYTS